MVFVLNSSFYAVVGHSHFIVYSRLALLQLVNDGPASTFTRDASKSAIEILLKEGGKDEELICRLCPKLKVIRKQRGGSTSNHMRHLKLYHSNFRQLVGIGNTEEK